MVRRTGIKYTQRVPAFRRYVPTGASRQKMFYNKRRSTFTVARTRGVYGQGEMKYFDTERSSTAIPAAADWTGTEFPPNVGTPTTLCNPVQGAGIDNRIGREIVVYKIKIRGQITVGPQTAQSAGDSASVIRMFLCQDEQTNATQAQGEQIMTDPATATAVQAVSTYQSLANFGRFRVARDKFFVIQNPNASNDTGATGGGIQQGLARTFKFNLKFPKGLRVRFNAINGGTIADIVDNSWCVYANCSSTTLAPAITYNSRVCYKEK